MGSSSRCCIGSHCIVCEKILAKYIVRVLDHPPYQADQTTCDFYLLPKVKSALKGRRFVNGEAMKEKAILNKLREENSRHLFEQRQIRKERCRETGGVY